MTSTAQPVIPADAADLLASTALAHVATIGPDGAPQVNPVWFDWDGRYLRFSQTARRQTYRSVRRDPRIAVSIVDPGNPYRSLELRGVVARIEPDPDLAFAEGDEDVPRTGPRPRAEPAGGGAGRGRRRAAADDPDGVSPSAEGGGHLLRAAGGDGRPGAATGPTSTPAADEYAMSWSGR